MPSHEIESQLRTIRSRIRAAQIRRALWVTATVALAGLIVTMAADWLFAPLPPAARWLLFGASLFAIALAFRRTATPLFQPISLVRIARWLEARHPEMEERLSTLLELAGNGSGVSPALLEALGRAAGEDIAKVDPRGEVKSARTSLRWNRPAAVLATLLLITLAIWPRETSRLLVRAIAPFSGIGNAGAVKFTLSPGDIEITEGDPVRIEVTFDGDAPSLDLILAMSGRDAISQPLARDGKSFVYLLDPARESFTYHAQSGRARSDAFRVKVHPLPRIADAKAVLHFPAYTGLPESAASPADGIRAVDGTGIRIEGTLNTAVRSASLEIDGKPVADGRLPSQHPGPITFSWTLAPGTSGEAVVRLTDPRGRATEALRFPVEAFADQPPLVTLVSPAKNEVRVRPDELLEIRYEVTEDFALARTLIETEAGGNRNTTLDLTLPFAVKGTRPPLHTGTAALSVGKLRQSLGDPNEIRIRVRADDARPADLGGPGTGRSGWLTLRIDRNAESLARQALRSEHDEARETLEKAIQETRQAKDQIDSLRDEVKKEQMSENARKRLAQSAEKLASAERKIDELAKEMEHGIHAAKAPETEKAAENLNQSREKLENAPLQDMPEKREQQLAEAKQTAEEAIKRMENVRERMDRDREKIQELARMQELAQQQRELARRAEENPADPSETKNAAQEWRNQQRQVAEQLKQQIRERQDARAEALRQQAENAKALAEEARQTSESQKRLQEQAQQVARPDQAEAMKEQLRNAISREQSDLAEEARRQLSEARENRTAAADHLPEATAAANEALEQLNRNDPDAAADAAEKSAEALQKAAEKEPGSGDALKDLAERQEQLAGAMEALAKNDTAAAFKALQESRAETAENLAEAIAETPLIDPTGNMNEATDNARQGASQAKEATKQQDARQPQAAQQHEQAADRFQKSAEALERAAEEFARQAEQAAAQQANPNRAPLPAEDLANAFQEAAEAAATEGAESAEAAREASDALAQATEAAREQMRGNAKPPAPGPNGNETAPAEQPPQMEGIQQRSADPGVPPELAKLGINAADWEKIRATLSSDVGAGGADAIPEEYRGLVRGYFESMSKKKD